MGANKPVAPASLLQVGGAGRVVGKKSLELWERLWEPKIATLVNVHEHGRTLPLVAVGDNRIGKKPSTEESSRKTKHAAPERPAKVHKHRTVRKKWERPSMYASGYRNRSYFGYAGHVTYGWGGYGRAYGWPQW